MAQTKSGTRTKKKSTASSTKTKAPAKKPIRRGVGALVCLGLGLFTFIGYFTVDAWLINWLCLYVFKGLLGWGFLAVPPCFFLAAWILMFHKGRPVKGRLLAAALIPVLFGAVVHLIACQEIYYFDWAGIRTMYLGGINMETGGAVSGAIADVLKSAVSIYGAMPILVVLTTAMICLAARISPKKVYDDIKNHEYPPYEPEPEPEPVPVRAPLTNGRRNARTTSRAESFDIDIPVDEPEKPKKTPTVGKRKNRWIDIPLDDDTFPEPEPVSPEPVPVKEESIPDMPQGLIYHDQPTRKERPAVSRERKRETVVPETETVEIPEMVDISAVEEKFPFLNERTPASELKVLDGLGEITTQKETPAPEEKISRSDVAAAADEIGQAIEDADTLAEYKYPSVDLLRVGNGITSDGREEVTLNRERLETALHSFGIGASVCEVTRGPTVTRYDLELETGVKLNKLTNLAGDLALALGVVSVRIAPIPDKISTVGVEVPNKIVSTVLLRDIIDSPAFRNAPSKLSFAVGKDIGGNCIVGNIAKLPHMLIAGTTGSGKSVCMNSLILSLLYKASPDEVKLIMIDPKMVELGIYNGIPHLYIPVVTDPKKAAGSLQWSVVEMMKRYRLFSEVGVRDLNSYNNYMVKTGQPTLPNVVIVIDELADLMMTAAKEVEESICRVAQMGRAAGMHLVIATQRPSADVITGLMKANIPSRIAFAVSSALESRIILDNQGAEKLVGMGDMLYAPLGSGKPLRVQGAFVTDEEREAVIDFIKEGAVADYDDEIMRHIEKAASDKDKSEPEDGPAGGSGEGNPFSDYDELLPQAVDVILDTKQASVSMLQRRLKLGYSRAARLVDQMEELGIVGPFEGSKPRQLLITREQWQEMSMTGNSPVERLMNEQKDDFSEGYVE